MSGGGGGSNNYIHKRGWVRRGRALSSDSKGVRGNADSSPPVAKPQPLFLLLRLFSMKTDTHTFDSDINLILVTTND